MYDYFSEGLHDSGVAETRWAVEIYEPAAKAFGINNKVRSHALCLSLSYI